MKTLFKLWVTATVCAVGGLAHHTEAQPSLASFGYGNMTTKRAIHTALILVNFTNNAVETEWTMPYRMGGTVVGTNHAAAELYYSNWFFGNLTSPPSVNPYFNEISNGRFQWLPASVIMVTLDTNHVNAAVLARNGGPGNEGAADEEYMSTIIGRAIAEGLDLNIYDTPAKGGNGDGVVSFTECTIQLLTNDKTFGGGARGWSGTAGVCYSGSVTIQRYAMGLHVFAEELIHALQNGVGGDIYGPSGMSGGFSVMSGGNALHVDAWHKLQLAWCEPRIHSLRAPAQFTLKAAQLMDSNAPVILYDPIRGAQEFFVLEYRSTNTASRGPGFDADVKDSGLVIWHVQQDAARNTVNYTTTYYPSTLQNWERCTLCFNLFRNFGASRPCAVADTNHVAQRGHLALPCDDPAAGGVSGWRWCQTCGQLYYHPNQLISVCSAGGQHLPGACDYRLRLDDDPEALGQRGWFHCDKCQSLYKPHIYDYYDAVLGELRTATNSGICKAGGSHEALTHPNSYTVLWTDGVKTMMTEGSPNLWRSRGLAWHSGDTTPPLRWYDGTLSRTRITVRPFSPSADQITIEIEPNFDVWVDFAYGGAEDGSFERPFNTFAEGVNVVDPGGVLHIKAGTSPETRHVSKAMKIESYGGPAKIGRQ